MNPAVARPRLHFLIPGDWAQPTGGYTYDRRIVMALEDLGCSVDVYSLPGEWPFPTDTDLAAAAEIVSQWPDNSLVVADGLAFGALDSLVALHASRLRWVALVHHPLHLETGLTEFQRGHLLATETAALRYAQRVVVTSHATASDVAAMGVPRDRIGVVEPGTDPAPLRPTTANIPTDTQANALRPLRLLCVATLTPRKGHSFLLAALDGLRHLPWELHNVGSTVRDPATAQKLFDQAASMSDRVFWHGEVDDHTLQAHYAAADVFVLASLHEGFGMVVNEALAHGLPVVASDAGALAQTLPPGVGLSVSAGSVPDLQRALERVLMDHDLRYRLARAADAWARRLPTWTQQARRFQEWIEDLK